MRWGDRGAADSYEIKVYEIDNVNCLQRRGLSSNRVSPLKRFNVLSQDDGGGQGQVVQLVVQWKYVF